MDLTTAAGRQELGVRIQSAIMAAGHDSLPEFARTLGWSRALIYQYVSGRVLVQLDRLQQIAHATAKPLEWFLAADPNGDATRDAEFSVRLDHAAAQVAATQEALAAERGLRLVDEQRTRETSTDLLLHLSAGRTAAAATSPPSSRRRPACSNSPARAATTAPSRRPTCNWGMPGSCRANSR